MVDHAVVIGLVGIDARRADDTWTRPGAEPSRADEVLTSTLKTALSLVDVRVLDHLIVAGNDVMSFAERGLL